MPIDMTPENLRLHLDRMTIGITILEQLVLALIPPSQREPVLISIRDHYLKRLSSHDEQTESQRESNQIALEEIQSILDITLPQVDGSVTSKQLWPDPLGPTQED